MATPSPSYLFIRVKHGTQNIRNNCHQWLSDSFIECTSFSAGDPPRTPLGELTVLIQTPICFKVPAFTCGFFHVKKNGNESLKTKVWCVKIGTLFTKCAVSKWTCESVKSQLCSWKKMLISSRQKRDLQLQMQCWCPFHTCAVQATVLPVFLSECLRFDCGQNGFFAVYLRFPAVVEPQSRGLNRSSVKVVWAFAVRQKRKKAFRAALKIPSKCPGQQGVHPSDSHDATSPLSPPPPSVSLLLLLLLLFIGGTRLSHREKCWY